MIDGAMAVTILKAKEGKDREEGTSRIDHVVVETDRVKELTGICYPGTRSQGLVHGLHGLLLV